LIVLFVHNAVVVQNCVLNGLVGASVVQQVRE